MGGVWRNAGSIADLGLAMADWLEGRLPSWPGYHGPFGQEEENGARHLVGYLAAVNRAGFVTTESQPGNEGRGRDGAHWRQRAYVTGVIDGRSPLLARVLRIENRGIAVVRGWPSRQLTLTDRNSVPTLTIGGFRLGRNQMAREWNGIGRQALRELREHGVAVNLYDPVWGRDSRLWPALIGAVR